MSQRLLDHKKWVWCCMALSLGPLLDCVSSVTVHSPPGPATVEAQAKFFQDFFSVQLSPYKLEFGHVCEDPNNWEQRYEKKDYKNHRDMGKVRWGDKHGGYGEHYWDLNHAGHAGDHGNDDYSNNRDDGSYNHDRDNSHDKYAEQTPSYGTDEYDSDQPQYEESGRAKRAHPRLKTERKKTHKIEEVYEEQPQTRPMKQRTKADIQAEPSYNVEQYEDEEEVTKKPLKKKTKKQKIDTGDEDDEPQDDQFEKLKETKEPQEQKNTFVPRRQAELNQYVPYEQGAGLRQHYHPEAAVAASTPRLFLEPSTGHVVDRATGQAYVLQPINVNNFNQ